MPTAREFEDAAIDYCLDHSGTGVWAVHMEQVNLTTYDITVRLGGHYRGEAKGVAVIRVTYSPQQQRYNCRPAESLLPDAIPVEDSAYLIS
jgi:hypothetical protein